MKLDNAIVLVTGANRGLGHAFAADALQRGARKVYAAARDPASVRLPGVTPIRLDVTRPDDIAAVARECGDTTVLINNAGIASRALEAVVGEESAGALEAGASEVLVDELTRQVHRGLSADPAVYLQPIDRPTR